MRTIVLLVALAGLTVGCEKRIREARGPQHQTIAASFSAAANTGAANPGPCN